MSWATADRVTAPVIDDSGITDRQWADLSTRLTDVIGGMSGRDDVIARIAPGLGCGAPAAFIPALARVEVDPSRCLPEDTDPDHVDPRTPSGRRAHPVLVGACAHEAGHAIFTRWNPPAGTGRAAAAAAGLLEETRMERRYVERRPTDRPWLQRSTAALVAGCDPEDATSPPVPWLAGKLAVLLCAREDAGVLPEGSTGPVEARVRAIVGDDTYDELRAIWLAAHECDDEDAEGMVALGARWCTALSVDPDGADPDGAVTMTVTAAGDGEGPAADGEGTGGTGADTEGDAGAEAEGDDEADAEGDAGAEGDAEGDTEAGTSHGTGDELLDEAVQATLDQASQTAEDEIAGGAARSHARAEAATRARTQHARERARYDEAARRTLSGETDRGTSSNIGRTRDPSPAERTAALRLARELDAARYRAPAVARIKTDAPPGRVRFGAAMQMQRQTELGLPVTARPFLAKRFTQQADPDLKVAILCDVSGSMSYVTGAVASTAWVLGEAAHRVNASVTTLLLGNGVAPLTKPGERPQRVRTFTAHDGMEEIRGALDAATGMLDLTAPTGPRLVFIVSDAEFVGPGQAAAARSRIATLSAAGVSVVWIPFGHYNPDALPGAHVAPISDTAEMPSVVGKTVLTAVRSAA